MARIKYYYDTETCKYERVKVKTSDVILNGLGILSLTVAMAAGLLTVYLYSNYFESPKELILKNEVTELEFYYQKLTKDVAHLSGILDNIEHRDDNIYRVVLGAEPIEKSVRHAGVGGSDRYIDIKEKDMAHEDWFLHCMKKWICFVESYTSNQNLRMKSLRWLKRKKNFTLPFQPSSLSRINNCWHCPPDMDGEPIPIYKVKKMHPGIDFAASIGTPIYATADGTVDQVSVKFSGYGKMVEIDHGFGYRTRYAHMHGFAVRSGQSVKRGDLIGYVGNTGMSTAPHLHYEVFINGEHVDPVHYFYNDLSPAEYEKVLELASIENQSLGM